MVETLDDVLADSLARLRDGAGHPGSAWRNLALATIGLDGTPQVRTVVLRRFDQAGRVLEVHTDVRSAKYTELRAHAAAALHNWDAGSRVQLRVTGGVSLHTTDEVADAAWAALRPESRATYRVLPGPGTALPVPDECAEADELAGRAVFCVVRLAMDGLEWLHLGRDRHSRARFVWNDGRARANWLAP